jgi:hypothetical protein
VEPLTTLLFMTFRRLGSLFHAVAGTLQRNAWLWRRQVPALCGGERQQAWHGRETLPCHAHGGHS